MVKGKGEREGGTEAGSCRGVRVRERGGGV